MVEKKQNLKNSHPLIWQENAKGQVELRSTLFDDPFFSSEGGWAECDHVFIKGNDLIKRWGEDSGQNFTIGELGFGTGLNFLETWRQWKAVREVSKTLHFISFEGFPLPVHEMSRALDAHTLDVLDKCPELAEISKGLIEKWPKLSKLNHWNMDEQTRLTLIIAPIEEGMELMNEKADAWYLDGFSPSKNPDMWSKSLLKTMFDKSNEGATLATYSSAGWVRRNMEEAGFIVKKAEGFGKKRHMLKGHV